MQTNGKIRAGSTFSECGGRVRLTALVVAALSLSPFMASPAMAQSIADQVGLTALIQRLGAGNQPTGAGIAVGQVEAQESPGNAYPNTSDPAFAGKTFTPMSGALGASAHATVVGQNLYGTNAIAPGITQIYAYQVFDSAAFTEGWLQCDYLNTAPGTVSNCPAGPPAAPPPAVRVFNNSWIGAFGSGSEWIDNDALRRADFAADRDDVLVVSGANNGGPQQPLMAYAYNGLSVGRVDGGHTSTDSGAAWDGPDRQKPEIVAPNNLTSFSTPIVSAAAALMYQTALTPPLSSNPSARLSEVIKAALLAGTNHGAAGTPNPHAWTNNPATSGPTRGITATPLDDVYGADLVNVDRSHRILTGLEQNGSATVPANPNATAAGWDLAALSAGNVLNYRFRLHEQVNEVSVLATWHRTVASNFASFSLANIDLTLMRINAAGQAVSLVGDAGLPYFASGNVVSQSSVDNVEHLFIRNLAAGDYVIELRRQNDGVLGSREVALAWIMPVTTQPGDTNGDGVVNIDDLLVVINAWGSCPNPGNCPADVTHDGTVNIDDLLLVINNWG